ncbi:hypothetical protein OGATHE_002325 [Ogataea polymorpha]|uniref:Uncharacterized protein n=1 Tax=Ogataea polymorpha TaxID=460523 RepID=A0A9P8TBB5_9ASCO|nr:hypothetical protein OGATHE_002325 [Ogataea polymorpha]
MNIDANRLDDICVRSCADRALKRLVQPGGTLSDPRRLLPRSSSPLAGVDGVAGSGVGDGISLEADLDSNFVWGWDSTFDSEVEAGPS